MNRGYRAFSTETRLPLDGTWTTLVGSDLTIRVGGGPLQVFLDVTLRPSVAGLVACRPVLTDRWLGAGTMPDNGVPEGETGVAANLPYLWSKTRLYEKIPAGTYTLAVQCSGDTPGKAGALLACVRPATCGVGFVELPP